MSMETADLLDLAQDFDRWREVYDELSFEDQKLVYARLRELWPNQRSFTLSHAYPFFDRYRPMSVIELGGWDGFLAACVLGQHPELRGWANYDLIAVLQSCVDVRYSAQVLKRPFWEKKRTADAFVATHTIEHIKERELEKLVACLNVKCCLIEAPIAEEPQDWDGYVGTHVLEVGWNEVDAIFERNGYGVDHDWPEGRYYAR